MIELIAPKISHSGKTKTYIHPDWQAWFDASAYSHEDARKELGLANGTFYRQIKKSPGPLARLAMRALYEGLDPWVAE